MTRRGLTLVVSLGLGAVLLGGCRAPVRPPVQEWEPEWEAAQRLVPDAGNLGRPPRHETCEDVLGQLRERRPELSPAPDEVVGAAVERWFEQAEGMFFDCFDDSDPGASIRAAYDQLGRLAEGVDAALAD